MTQKTMTLTLLKFEYNGEVLGTGSVWGSADPLASGALSIGKLHAENLPEELFKGKQQAVFHNGKQESQRAGIKFLKGRFVLSGAQKEIRQNVMESRRKLG